LPGPKVGPASKKEKPEFLEDFDETEMNPNPEGGKRNKIHIIFIYFMINYEDL